MTGLTDGQLAELTARVHAIHGALHSNGRPYVLGLYRSIAMVTALMRKNITQDLAGAIFGVSQSTASRRWDLLRPLIGEALDDCVPDPQQVIGTATVLVDGTICPTWDWKAIPDLYSGKTGYPGVNIQIAATLNGDLAAIGPIPVHGARHDAHAYAASGLAASISNHHTLADLGYTGVDGIDIVPIKRLAGGELDESQAEFNTQLSALRAAVERAVAHLKTWRMLSEEGGRYRPPIHKYESMLRAITGLIFFTTYE
jgi:hypothetical protein